MLVLNLNLENEHLMVNDIFLLLACHLHPVPVDVNSYGKDLQTSKRGEANWRGTSRCACRWERGEAEMVEEPVGTCRWEREEADGKKPAGCVPVCLLRWPAGYLRSASCDGGGGGCVLQDPGVIKVSPYWNLLVLRARRLPYW